MLPDATRPGMRLRALPALLLVLTAFGPLSMDLYLPALPALTVDLGASTSIAQLTITACLVGLALGQLVAGPMSDRRGRRPVVLVGVVAYVVASVACAISPSVELLVGARLVQGLAGGAGIVVALSAGRDRYDGSALLRFYGRVTIAGGVAAIVGPMLGGVLTAVMDWRGLFLLLAGVGAGILLLVVTLQPETLDPARRTAGGLRRTVRDYRSLLADRVVVAALANQAALSGALFAYLAGATYVLQDVYDLTPQQYAAAFALNSAGFVAFGALSTRASERWSLHGVLVVGAVVAGLGAIALVVTAVVSAPLAVVVVAFLALVGGVAISTPPATTLALVGHPDIAGTASSLLGMVRFGAGALAAPIVGLAGATAVLPLGLVTSACVALAALAILPLARASRRLGARTDASAVSDAIEHAAR